MHVPPAPKGLRTLKIEIELQICTAQFIFVSFYSARTYVNYVSRTAAILGIETTRQSMSQIFVTMFRCCRVRGPRIYFVCAGKANSFKMWTYFVFLKFSLNKEHLHDHTQSALFTRHKENITEDALSTNFRFFQKRTLAKDTVRLVLLMKLPRFPNFRENILVERLFSSGFI